VSAHRAELAGEPEAEAGADDEGALATELLLDPHATVRSMTPQEIAASRHHTCLAWIPGVFIAPPAF